MIWGTASRQSPRCPRPRPDSAWRRRMARAWWCATQRPATSCSRRAARSSPSARAFAAARARRARSTSLERSGAVPRREILQRPPDAQRHRVHADGSSGDAPDVAPDFELVFGCLAAELLAPRLIRDLPAVRLTVDEDVDVFEPIRGIGGDEKRDGSIFAFDV